MGESIEKFRMKRERERKKKRKYDINKIDSYRTNAVKYSHTHAVIDIHLKKSFYITMSLYVHFFDALTFLFNIQQFVSLRK